MLEIFDRIISLFRPGIFIHDQSCNCRALTPANGALGTYMAELRGKTIECTEIIFEI